MTVAVQRNVTPPPAIWLPQSPGAKAETCPRALMLASGTSTTLTSGTLFLQLLHEPLRTGVTYTSASFMRGGGGVTWGGSPHLWYTLVRASDRVTLRSTADDTSATAWATDTVKTINLSSAYTPTVDTVAYLGVMIAASTPGSLRSIALGNTIISAIPPIMCGTSSTGQTTAPSDGSTMGAITATGGFLWGWMN